MLRKVFFFKENHNSATVLGGGRGCATKPQFSSSAIRSLLPDLATLLYVENSSKQMHVK